MSKATDTIACPACGTELTLEHLMGHLDDQRAFSQLIALSVPLAHLVVRYVNLFTPDKQRLTLRKKVRLIAQLLPDLRRQAITHKGRDWTAPMAHWEKAIDQMLAARAAGRLDLPMTGHGYLYSILAGLADRQEAAAEAQAEADRRQAPQRATVQVRGQTMSMGDALQQVYGDRDPALVKAEQAARDAAPMPDSIRQRIEQLKKGA